MNTRQHDTRSDLRDSGRTEPGRLAISRLVQHPRLLLINGIVLAFFAVTQFVFDLLGYTAGIGLTGPALHNNPDAIGFVEAHGLAAIIAALLILRRHDGFGGWHVVALSVHLLLGLANIIFWSAFTEAGLVGLGIVATTMHAVFVALHLWAILSARR